MPRSENLEPQWTIDSTKEPMGFKVNDNATPVGPSLSRSTEAGQATKLYCSAHVFTAPFVVSSENIIGLQDSTFLC